MPIRLLAAFLCLLIAAPALAGDDGLLGKWGAWEAHRLERSGEATCYAISRPRSTAPRKLNRGETYFTVTYWPSRERAEPSIVAGFDYRKGSAVAVSLGKAKFGFFTQGDGAWLASAKEESRLVADMKKGRALTVRGISARGTRVTDSYSLSGFSRALDKAAAACK